MYRKAPRPLLEFWRGLNRDRAGAPSELLKPVRASMEGLQRFAQSAPGRELRASIERFAQSAPARELREALQRMHETGPPEKLMGRMRPASSPSQLTKRMRKPGAGRKPGLTPEQKAEGIRILRSHPRMSVDAACATLREAGIKGGNTTLNQWIVKEAYGSRS